MMRTHATMISCCSLARPLVACIVASSILAIDARADTLTAGGAVYENVRVQTVRAGKVFYLDSAGDLLQAPVEAVESMRFEGLTELDDAQRSMSKEEWEEALPKLLAAMHRAQGDAQKLWTHAKLAETHSALGDYIEAAGHAAAVLDIDPAPVWLSLIPTGEMNEPTFYSAGEADYFLKRARRKATDAAVVAALELLTAQIAPVAQELASEDARQYRPGSTISGILVREIARPPAPRERDATSSRPDDPADDDPEVARDSLPGTSGEMTGPQSPGAIDGLLEDNEFIAALAICGRVAEGPGQRDLAQFLHQYGRALAGSAQEADAAVRFMQCAIEFPDTTYATRAIIETAIIYRQFYQKPDTADRLLLLAAVKAEEEGDAEALERARGLMAGAQQ